MNNSDGRHLLERKRSGLTLSPLIKRDFCFPNKLATGGCTDDVYPISTTAILLNSQLEPLQVHVLANVDNEEKQCQQEKKEEIFNKLGPQHRGVKEKEDIGCREACICMKDGLDS